MKHLSNNESFPLFLPHRSYLVLRSGLHHLSKYFACYPVPVIGGLSEGERAALSSTQHERVFLVRNRGELGEAIAIGET